MTNTVHRYTVVSTDEQYYHLFDNDEGVLLTTTAWPKTPSGYIAAMTASKEMEEDNEDSTVN